MPGGRGSGQALFAPFKWTQQIDQSTPLIMVGVATGEHYRNATLDVTRPARGSANVFFQMKFDDVFISKLDIAGAGDTPTVAGAMGYSKVTMTYWAQNPNGSLGKPIVGGWDLRGDRAAFFGSPLALQGLALAMPAPSAVPVPAAVWLLGSGLLGLVGVARRSSAPIAV